MGTRNLTCVILDDEPKVAKYCQWDGYPDGQGATIYGFIKEELDLETFKEQVRKHIFISQEEYEQLWKDMGVDLEASDGRVNLEQSRAFSEKYPALSRDCGADILNLIAQDAISCSLDQYKFAADGLFCEWAYVVDLDREVLEVYAGFFRELIGTHGRFDTMLPTERDNEYMPVQKIVSFAFDDLPETKAEFVEIATKAKNKYRGEEDEDDE